MSYVLATTENIVRWYKLDIDKNLPDGKFILIDVLDLNQVTMFANKEIAKNAAKSLGLKTFRYVEI